MPSATSINYLQYGTSWDSKPFNKGWSRVRFTAKLPSGDSTCTIANIPDLTPHAFAFVSQMQTGGNAAPLIHIIASDTNGTTGTITIGTGDGSTVSNDTEFMCQIVNY